VMNINGRNVQAPCIGFKVCSGFGNNNKNTKESVKYAIYRHPRFICSECFQTEGVHLFERKGSGTKPFSCHEKHNLDNTEALKLLGRWILNIAESNENMKSNVLLKVSSTLDTIFDKMKQDESESNTPPPSLLLVKTMLRLGKVNIKKLADEFFVCKLSGDNSKKIGEAFALATWKSRSNIWEKKAHLKHRNHLRNIIIVFRLFCEIFLMVL